MSEVVHWLVLVSAQVAWLGLLALLLERLGRTSQSPRVLECLWSIVLLRCCLPPRLLPEAMASATQVPLPWHVAEATAGSAGIVVSVWAIGAVLFAVFGCRGMRRLRAELGHKKTAAAGLQRCWRASALQAARALGLSKLPRICPTDSPLAPCVAGAWSPTVYVPRTAALTPASRTHTLLHEFGHIRRRDPLRATLALCVQVVFWFHPLVWLATAKLQLARELACDELAARNAVGGTNAYRKTLQRWVAARLDHGRLLPAHGFGGRRQLASRLQALAGQRLQRWWLGGAACIVLALFGVMLAATEQPAHQHTALAEALTTPGCFHRRHAVLAALFTADGATAAFQ